MKAELQTLTIQGFKSIRNLTEFSPGPLTVLIGPNGSGKSNLISVFRLLSWMLASPGSLAEFVARSGYAHQLFHDGPDVTSQITAHLTIVTDVGVNEYLFRLVYGYGDDSLIFTDERFRFFRSDREGTAPWKVLGSGHREALIIAEAEGGNVTARTMLSLLRTCKVYQFHNTSSTARMRRRWDANDNRQLKEDAGNLAPLLMRLRDEAEPYYQRIVDTLRMILPFFADFELRADAHGSVLLQWREQGTDIVFSPSQASDGMLRTMALIALLCQPEDDLPEVLILDEPELGLHPYAITAVAGLFRSVSTHVQVMVATQSASLVDQFDPEHIVVVSRKGRESRFERLDPKRLEGWLEDYSIAELWEKNVLGGRP
ncbi:MAG: AAA family ATPase [Thermodesulfobacteriota bacterium]